MTQSGWTVPTVSPHLYRRRRRRRRQRAVLHHYDSEIGITAFCQVTKPSSTGGSFTPSAGWGTRGMSTSMPVWFATDVLPRAQISTVLSETETSSESGTWGGLAATFH